MVPCTCMSGTHDYNCLNIVHIHVRRNNYCCEYIRTHVGHIYWMRFNTRSPPSREEVSVVIVIRLDVHVHVCNRASLG